MCVYNRWIKWGGNIQPMHLLVSRWSLIESNESWQSDSDLVMAKHGQLDQIHPFIYANTWQHYSKFSTISSVLHQHHQRSHFQMRRAWVVWTYSLIFIISATLPHLTKPTYVHWLFKTAAYGVIWDPRCERWAILVDWCVFMRIKMGKLLARKLCCVESKQN